MHRRNKKTALSQNKNWQINRIQDIFNVTVKKIMQPYFCIMDQKAYFFPEDIHRELLSKLDMELLVCGEATNVRTLPEFHPFRSDSFFRIYYADQGSLMIAHLEGTLICKPGNLYLIPADRPFRYLSKGEGFTHRWIHFRSWLLASLTYFHRPIEVSGSEELDLLMTEFLCLAQQADDFRHILEADLHLRALLLPFLANMTFDSEQLPDSHRFASVLSYIDEHIAEPLNIAQLAALARLEKNRFTAEFHQAFGIPPKQYLVRYRINSAKHLLLTTPMGIKEIACRVGYDNEYFFYRIFKKHTGVTPSEFRCRSYTGY